MKLKFWLFRFFTVIVTIFIMGCFNCSIYAQETIDSVTFGVSEYHRYRAIVFLNESFSQHYPMGGKENSYALKLIQFSTEAESSKGASRFYPSQSALVYEYRKGGYRYEMLNNPLQMHLHFSMKEQYGWDDFDVYFDGSAALSALYIVDEATKTFVPLDRDAFFWESSVGGSYEFSPKKELFLEHRWVGGGANLIWKGYNGGLRMKF